MKPYKTYELSDLDRQKMLDDAIIVLDTCAICSLYNLTEYHRSTMITILEHLKDRIWLPRQVLCEYDRNRRKAICNPKTEKYRDPSFTRDTFVKDVRAEIEKWKSNEYWHPFLEASVIENLEKEVEEANNHLRIIKETVKKQYEKRRSEIDTIVDNDPLESFVNSLAVEEELQIKYLRQIAYEGERRYANGIPPGFKDSTKPDEGDPFRKYGDLIIWKSIINYAREVSRNIVFITDDLKQDWAIGGKLRPELVSEFSEESGQKVDMYSLRDFIEALKKHYINQGDENSLFGELESVVDALERLKREMLDEHGCIKLKCDECGEVFKVYQDELWMEWDSEGDFDRGMGVEREWYCGEHIQCPHCNSSIEIDFSAEEYPVGVINNFEINCFGANKVGVYRKDRFLPEISDYYSNCDCCGELSDDIQDGLCPECRYRRDKILADD